MKIYADNAATTKMSEAAINAMLPYLNEVYANPSSPYKIGQKSKKALEDARRRAAAVLNCDAREIYFTSGGSEADNQAIISAARLGAKSGRKHIISTAFEHHAVLNTLKSLENEGFEIELLDVHSNGVVTAKQVNDAIREDTALVTVMYANNEIGTLQPIYEIGEVCKARNVLFHTDAVQAMGHVLVDVKKDNVDMLSLSAHKFHGPKGAGILYARKEIQLTSIIHGGAQERGRRAGTENLPAIAAMVRALEDAAANAKEYASRMIPIRDRLIEGLEEIPYSVLNGDRQKRLPGTVNFCFEGIEAETLLYLLDDKGISASSGSACTSGSLEPSHVIVAIGRAEQLAYGSLRLSLPDDITAEEIDYLIRSVREVVETLRKMSPFWKDLESGKIPHVLDK